MWLVIGLLCAACGASIGAPDDTYKHYDGYQTYNLTLNTKSKISFVNQFDGLDGYDFWLPPNKHRYAQIMVAPELQTHFEKQLKDEFIHYEIVHTDIGQLIKEQLEYQKKTTVILRSLFDFVISPEFDFNHFPRYDEIVDFMQNLVLNKTYTKMINVGNSSEGRPIYGVEVRKYLSNPVFMIDAGIHAREWPSHVAAMYIMKRIAENENEFADKMSLIIIPCANPDGYEYSHTSDRLWRKSRSSQSNSNCSGVDLNRNFDSHWGEFRAKSDPCHYLFAGSKPFSEPESKAIRNVIVQYKPTAYLTLHSFGGYILYPWGFTKILPHNWINLHRIAYNVAERVKEMNGTNYRYGSSALVLYEASGASDDWAMEKGNVSFVFTMELPGYGGQAFIMPEDKIPQMVHETYEAFIVMFDEIYNKISEVISFSD